MTRSKERKHNEPFKWGADLQTDRFQKAGFSDKGAWKL